MRALHVLDCSLPRVAGYTSRTRSILVHQAKIGISPLALTGLRQGESPQDRETIEDIDHYRTRAPDRRLGARLHAVPLGREAVEMACLGRRILEVYREAKVDLLHAHSPILCGIPAYTMARKLGLPCVYEIRAFWEDAAARPDERGARALRYAATRGLETGLCRSVDAVIAICEGIRRELLARGVPDEKVFVVPNGVDVERFKPREARPSVAERYGLKDKIVIAYLGTLFDFEGVALLLTALARITREDDRVRGIIVGGGESEGELRALHEDLGLGDRVVLTGKVSPAETLDLYALADVLCYPRQARRITELTTPLKPLEAMCMRRAVVASDVGGLRELIDDEETGLLFKAGDIDALMQALTRVTRDADLRRALGEGARAHVIAERSWAAIARRYLTIYEAALARNARRARGRLALAA